MRTPPTCRRSTHPTDDPRRVPIAIFHTDVTIAGVRIAVKAPPAPVKRATRGAVRTPVSEKADQKIPAGSYILGLWFGEAAVFAKNLDFVGYLGKPTVVAKNLGREGPEAVPVPASIALDGDVETVKFGVWLPSGGKGVPDSTGWLISWGNKFEEGALEKAGRNWRDSPPTTK